MKKALLITLLFGVVLAHAKQSSPEVFLEAHVNMNQVELNWSTHLHLKGGYFIVQRSVDAKNWEQVLAVRFKGANDQLVDYFEIDSNPKAGSSFYRLKRVYYDGTVSYSNVVPVCYKHDIQVVSTYELTKDKIKCESNNKPWVNGEEFFVVLRDKLGNEYYCKAYITEHNGSLVAEPIGAILPEGTYLVIASNNDSLYSHQLAVKD